MSLVVDARTIKGDGLLTGILAESGNFLRWSIATAGVLALGLAPRFSSTLSAFFRRRTKKSMAAILIFHISLYGLLVVASTVIFDTNRISSSPLDLLWLLLAGMVFFSCSLLVTTTKNWWNFIQREKTTILVAVLGGTLIFLCSLWARQYWGSLSGFTLNSSKTMLSWFYDEVIFDEARRNLGVRSFWVNIAPVCSGIEGMVLAFSTSAIYLFLSRHYLKFPRALVLLPLACIISIALNLVRIVALIVIGAEYSPALAIGGFHSVAGWITSVLVALLIVFVFSNWTWIQAAPDSAKRVLRRFDDSYLSIATLVPFVIFAGVSLISGIFNSGFDFIYPLKVILVSAAITFFWHRYQITLPEKVFESVAVGLVVAVLWIVTFPTDDQQNLKLVEHFNLLPLWGTAAWVVFRLIGFWIIAPILEELVFRGYLLARLSGQEFDTTRKPRFSLIALIVSSVLFGLLHTGWVAGTLAGILFAILRFRSSKITDPILAHGVANVAVASWAAYTGNWSLI